MRRVLKDMMLDAALEYAARGWPVFPCHTMQDGVCSCGDPACISPGKHPLTQRGHLDGSTNQTTIRYWWQTWPDANIGFAVPPTMAVIDVDIKPNEGKHGDESLAALEAIHGELPDTVRSLTGGGGVQHFFTVLPSWGLTCRNPLSDDPAFDSIDLKTKGGYVILPPSLHASGRRYEWETDHAPGEAQTVEMPRWIAEARHAANSRPASTAQNDGKIPQGQRNSTLHKLASSMRSKGFTEDAILVALLADNQARCEPPLPEKEVRTIARSAGKYEQGMVHTAASDFAGLNIHLAKPQDPPSPPEPPKLVFYDTVDYEEPEFLIKPYIPLGKITIIQADSGVGKTALACKLAACVSRGMPMQAEPCMRGRVLVLSVEDDPSTLRGRIEASGGDLTQCAFLDNAHELTFTSEIIETTVRENGIKLLIFDPLQAFLGSGMDMHRANETRPIMAHLAAMAKRTECAVIIISHMSKGTAGGKAIYRALGSVDIPAASRSVLYVERNPQDEEQCVIVHIKSSNAKAGQAILYRIGERGGVHWEGYSSITMDDLIMQAERKDKGVDYEDEPIVIGARAFITENPKGGKLTYDEFHTLCVSVSGIAPYADNRDAAYKIPKIKPELMQNDRILIETGAYVRRSKGISITPYSPPTAFQTGIATEATET